MNLKCKNCGSEKMIAGVSVEDQGRHSHGTLRAYVGSNDPAAVFIPKPVFAKFKANICGECGHVELLVDNPAELYAAYTKWQEHQLKT